MGTRDKGRRLSTKDHEKLYEDLGPLTLEEVRWLAERRETDRAHYFHTIYSTVASKYAKKCYETLKRGLDG